MTKKKRYLITTSDENTWKFDRPVIFLGEWCRRTDRKYVWQDLDAIVSEPYGLDFSVKIADKKEIFNLEEKLFPEICNLLNQYHDTKYDSRYWRIILGHWFRLTLQVLLNRANVIKQCIDTYEISGVTSYHLDYCSLTTFDFNSAQFHITDDECWNNTLNIRIIKLLKKSDFPIEFVNKKDEQRNSKKSINTKKFTKNQNLKKDILKFLLKSYQKIARKMIKNQDAFIRNTYLPIKEEIKLELSLGQIPQIWKLDLYDLSSIKNFKKPNKLLRKNLTKKIINNSLSSLENLTRTLFFELLPTCYLEGYRELKDLADKKPWPKSPKFIFTSNNYQEDEVFKIWLADKIMTNSKYYVGQHGNNYGTNYLTVDNIEEQTSDKFISWGWKNSTKQIPAFMFKSVGEKMVNINPNGRLLLVEYFYKFGRSTWDSAYEFINYYDDQKEFVKQLDNSLRQEVIIRLDSNSYNCFLDQEKKWSEFDIKLKIDLGKTPMKKLIADSRLIVFSYDSTGMLETLSQNIPTLVFWQNQFDYLTEDAKPYYQLLIDAEIICLSPKSAAKKVNMVWHNIYEWWNLSEVQEARKKFCNYYAKTSKNPVSELRNILLS